MNKTIGFIGGEFMSPDECMVSVDDRGYVFGDGVYDVACTFNGVPFALDDHLDRFYRSMELIDINPQYTRAEIVEIIEEGLKRTNLFSANIYMQMTRGIEKRAHSYGDDLVGNFMMTIRPRPDYTDVRDGVDVITTPDVRWKRCNVKSLNLLPNILAAKEAKRKGCFDAIFIRDGFAVEGTSSNLWFVKDGKLYTEPLSDLILNGISRAHIKEIAINLGYEVIEKHSTLEELLNADEAFYSSTTKLLLNINSVDGNAIGNGEKKISQRLYRNYVDIVSEKVGYELDYDNL